MEIAREFVRKSMGFNFLFFVSFFFFFFLFPPPLLWQAKNRRVDFVFRCAKFTILSASDSNIDNLCKVVALTMRFIGEFKIGNLRGREKR